MQCSYKGQFDIHHTQKRRLMGSEMNRALSAMITQKENASIYIRSEANRLMKEGMLLKVVKLIFLLVQLLQNNVIK